jgi:hypothetical protein
VPQQDYPPDQSYFPGAKIRLILRVEEYSQSIVDPSKLQPPQLIKGTQVQAATLTYQQDPTAPPGIVRYVIASSADAAAPGGPQAQSTSSDGLTQVVAGIIPHDAKMGRNGWKQGDTLDVAFRYIDLPVDPRAFRSVAIEFYLGVLTQQQFSAGVSGQSQSVPQGQTQTAVPANMIPDTWVDAAGNQRTNLRFQGWVDDWEYDWTAEGTALVRMKCVDNTRLLLDQEMPPQMTIDVTKPVDQAVAQLLTNFPQMQGLTVEYRPAVAPGSIPILQGILGPTAYRPDLGGPTASKGSGTSGTNKQSVWDYLVEIMLLIGHNCRMEGTNIIIQRVRTATSKGFPPRYDDPFTGYTWADGQVHPLRTFVWGRNVMAAKCGRKYTRSARKNIEIRCLVGESLIEARDIEKAYRRWYSGSVVTVTGEGGRVLTGTPNHPMLTARGWVPLGELVEGDDLVCCSLPERGGGADLHVDAAPTEFRQLFDSLPDAGGAERVAGRKVDFHGDGMESEVEVVTTGGLLRHGSEPSPTEHLRQIALEAAGKAARLLKYLGSFLLHPANLFACPMGAPHGVVHGLGEGFGALRPQFSESVLARGAEVSDPDAGEDEQVPDGSRVELKLPGQVSDGGPVRVLLWKLWRCFQNGGQSGSPTSLVDVPARSGREPGLSEASAEGVLREVLGSFELSERRALGITTSKVLKVERRAWAGHVFNLQTRTGWYVANGILSHNCYDPGKKQTLVARHPPLVAGNDSSGPQTVNKRAVSTLPGDGGNVTKYCVYTVSGITDLNTLQKVAQHYYEGLNRGELLVKLSTRNVASYGGDNSDPDLLDLLAGDRIEYLVDRVDLSQPTAVSQSIGELESAATQQAAAQQQLAALGFDPGFVAAYLTAFSSTSFQTQFVVKSGTLAWDVDKGIDLDFEAVNFVEVALDANSGFDDSSLQPQAGTQPTKTQQSSGVNG